MFDNLETQLERELAEEVRKWHRRVWRYGNHTTRCSAQHGGDCNCGWYKVWTELREIEKRGD